jgi:hypothetical protein
MQTSAESQEVLAVLLTLVESGIEEEDIWNGEPGTSVRLSAIA